LDPLNTPVTVMIPVSVLDPMVGTSPPSSGLVKGSLPVPMLPPGMDTSMGSTRLVSGTGLASKLPSTAATLMESAKLVLLILPASMQLVVAGLCLHLRVHQLIRVSRTVCVTHVPVHLMTQVSLTSVVTNWTLENCSMSSTISSSPRLNPKTSAVPTVIGTLK